LSRADAGVIKQQLWTIPSQYHQSVLDALAVKLAAIMDGKSPPFRWGPLTYARKLCELAVSGKLNPVPTIAPTPKDDPDNTNATPQTQEMVDRALKALECELSNVSAEAKRLRLLAKQDSSLAGAVLEAEGQWKEISQRYTELKQMQGRVLH
jgi:hypothetical protein